MIPDQSRQSFSLTHRLMAPPAAPQVSGRVIQASVWTPRSIHCFIVLSAATAEFIFNFIKMLYFSVWDLSREKILFLQKRFIIDMSYQNLMAAFKKADKNCVSLHSYLSRNKCSKVSLISSFHQYYLFWCVKVPV